MNHIGLLIIAGVLGLASIAAGIGGQYLSSGSGGKFMIEKILSRSLGLAALVLLFIFGVKAMT